MPFMMNERSAVFYILFGSSDKKILIGFICEFYIWLEFELPALLERRAMHYSSTNFKVFVNGYGNIIRSE